jgi:hypothetical protein
MKVFYENSYSMELVVMDFMKENVSIWGANVPLTVAFNKFKDMMAEIKGLFEIVMYNILGAAAAKKQKREFMTEGFLFLKNAVIPYANEVGDAELKALFKFSKWKLNKFRDTEVVEKMRGYRSKALTLVSELSEFGIDAAWLDGFAVLIDNYESYISKPRIAITERKSANAMLVAKIKESKLLLKGQVDLMVYNYGEEEPAFVEGYKNARIIVDYPG